MFASTLSRPSEPTLSLGESAESSTTEAIAQVPSLAMLFRMHRGRILLTYGLFNLENLVRLGQPFVLGWAVDDLIQGHLQGLFFFLLAHLAYLGIGTGRRALDTRIYCGVYQDLAPRVVLAQKQKLASTSQVAARSSLARELIDFFERDIPVILYSAYSVLGALGMLALTDVALVPGCLIVLVPAWFLNHAHAVAVARLSRQHHDELEREVAILHGGEDRDVRDHYRREAGWRIRLSDADAGTFSGMQICNLALLGFALVWTCRQTPETGHIFAVFGYLMMFIGGVVNLPNLVQQIARLRDIQGRIR